MRFDELMKILSERGENPCLVARDEVHSSEAVVRRVDQWAEELKAVPAGSVVGIQSRFSVEAVSLLLAVLRNRCIAALVPESAAAETVPVEDGCIEVLFRIDREGGWEARPCGPRIDHPLLRELRAESTGGLVIFSSGSTGRPKAVLHSIERFLSKFDAGGKKLRTLAFLLFDHIAGQDTLFYTLCSGGVLIVPDALDIHSTCAQIEKHQVEVLPVSPTFLNLFCVSGDYRECDLSSLKIITYGSEPMSPSILYRVCEILPDVQIIQKYGTSEFGSPRARSRGSDSVWLKLKSDELETKIEDGILWVRSPRAMLGYLNAASPFDEEGWMCTGDLVERDGEWIRIRGRASELIIVGGEKVYPQEVEAAILELDFVTDVVVAGEPYPLTGQIVTARVNVLEAQAETSVAKRIRRHCRARLDPYKVPVKVDVVTEPLASERQKKLRQRPAADRPGAGGPDAN